MVGDARVATGHCPQCGGDRELAETVTHCEWCGAEYPVPDPNAQTDAVEDDAPGSPAPQR